MLILFIIFQSLLIYSLLIIINLLFLYNIEHSLSLINVINTRYLDNKKLEADNSVNGWILNRTERKEIYKINYLSNK